MQSHARIPHQTGRVQARVYRNGKHMVASQRWWDAGSCWRGSECIQHTMMVTRPFREGLSEQHSINMLGFV